MQVSDIIDLARNQTYTTSDQVSDDQALRYLNIVYRDVLNNIIDEDQGYFWQSATTALESDQNEYRLPIDYDKIDVVFVKYDGQDDYQKCTLSSFSELDYDIEDMNDIQTESNPIAVVADDSIFIMPAPDADNADGIKLLYTEFPQWLELSDSSTDIPLPSQYHDVLWIGMKQYIFASRGMFDEKNNSFQEYANMINKIKAYVKPRITSARLGKDINLDYLK